MFAPHRTALLAGSISLCLASATGCDSAPTAPAKAPAPKDRPATGNEPPVAPAQTQAPLPVAATTVAPAKAGEEILVPAGQVRLGSLPGGEQARRPQSEADSVSTQVPAFHIDRLPYPNDPKASPKVAVDRKQARALCEQQGKRLCHEVEWERACKGDADRVFPTSNNQWGEAPCGDDGLACATPFGLLRMGVDGREWTDSDATAGLGDRLRTAVVRGAAADAEPLAHRCAARDSATPGSRSDSLTFRCCRGPAPALTYPAEAARDPFELHPMDDAAVRKWLSQFSEVQDLARDFAPFRGDDYARALSKGGKSKQSIAPWIPVEHPLIWSPVHGESVWVLNGKTAAGAVVLFAYALQDGSFRFGGSFELQGEPDPVAIAFNPEHPEQLLWSSCWGCGGEGGAIELRDDGRIVIVQR